MSDLRKFGGTGNKLRFTLKKASTGLPYTGLTFSSSGLIISTITDVESSAIVYAQASGNVEDITTLGTFAAPTTNKCRFKEVSPTNHPGTYEYQIADARFAVANSKRMVVTVSGVTDLLTSDYEIQLTQSDFVTLVDDLWAAVIDNGYTAKQIMELIAAEKGGQLVIVNNGDGTYTYTYKRIGDPTTTRVVATSVGPTGRSGITLTLP